MVDLRHFIHHGSSFYRISLAFNGYTKKDMCTTVTCWDPFIWLAPHWTRRLNCWRCWWTPTGDGDGLMAVPPTWTSWFLNTNILIIQKVIWFMIKATENQISLFSMTIHDFFYRCMWSLDEWQTFLGSYSSAKMRVVTKTSTYMFMFSRNDPKLNQRGISEWKYPMIPSTHGLFQFSRRKFQDTWSTCNLSPS